MRVMLLMNSLYTGGAEFSSLQLYGWLKSRGHEVKVVCVKTAVPSYDFKEFGLNEVYYLKGESWWSKFQDCVEYIRLVKPDLVHSVLFDANIIGRLSRMRLRSFIHLESLVNEMYSENRYADPQVTRLKLWTYRVIDFVTQLWGVDHFHANGESVARHYEQKLKIDSNRITIISRGRSTIPFAFKVGEHKRQVRTELGIAEQMLLINVARHEYQKGQDVLIEAINRLQNMSDKIKLVLVGREGKLTEGLKQKIADYKLEDSVTMLGHRSDVQSLLAAADVFVFPSRFEGLSGALIEAEAAGLPIICSDIPNNREVAIEGKNALYFPVDDADKLADQLKLLIENEALRQEMGAHSLTIFKEKFSLEKSHQQMLHLLEDLIHRHS